MLIIDGKLDIEKFKLFASKAEWIKAPRKLTEKRKDYFYVCKYEDDEKIIDITIRPSNWMQVKESLKNCNPETGKVVPESQRAANRRLCNYGSSVQVLVDESFVKKISSMAKDLKKKEVQKISWD